MLDALLDFPVSLGWVQAGVRDALTKAQALKARHDLSLVQAAALDEIFPNGAPVLTVVDVPST